MELVRRETELASVDRAVQEARAGGSRMRLGLASALRKSWAVRLPAEAVKSDDLVDRANGRH